MKRFWLFVNWKKEHAAETAAFVREWMLRHGAESVVITDELDPERIRESADCLITLGGDGTIIRASRRIAGSGIPIAGVNLGNLGYLTAVSSKTEIPELLDALLCDQYRVENRMMLKGMLGEGEGCLNQVEKPHLALNEIVLHRHTDAAAVEFRVLVNGAFLNEYKSDGIIISTPTGSTAYNLSAGGPIVDPSAKMKILTPICPHALNRSSIVLKAEDRLDILIPPGNDGEISVSFDGAVNLHVGPGGCVRITETECTTPLVLLPGGTFLTQLRNKMTTL